MRTRSSVSSGRSSSPATSGRTGLSSAPGPDGDDHQRHLGVGGEEAGALADAVRRPVDAEQDGGAEQAVAAQQLHDGHEGGTAPDPFVAPAVDGQLGRLVQLLGEGDRAHAPG